MKVLSFVFSLFSVCNGMRRTMVIASETHRTLVLPMRALGADNYILGGAYVNTDSALCT